MEKAHSRIKWENYPSIATPLNETNLNKMDIALDEVDNRVLGLDTAKLDKSVANSMVKEITFDEATGIFTITSLDGTTKTIDTKLEKVATNFSYDYDTQKLKLTLLDGTEQEIDMSSLISQYEFVDTSTIGFTVGNEGKITAIVKDGSITEDKLQPNFLADVKVEVAKAKSYSDSSYDNATTSSNASAQAKQYRDEAKQYRDEVQAVVDVDIATTTKAGLVKPDGTTITIDADGTIHSTATGGTEDYTDLNNKPSINGVELSGNKTTADLNIKEGTTNYTELSNKPSINGVELTGALTTDDLNIDVGTVDYTDLQNKPTINGVEITGNLTSDDLNIKSGDNAVELTQAEYDALDDSKLTNNVEYRITDAGINEATASNVSYDNSVSGLEATTVQGAIDKTHDGLTWKESERITGTTEIPYPSNANEIIAMATIINGSSSITVVCTLLPQMKGSYLNYSNYASASWRGNVQLFVSTNNTVKINVATFNDVECQSTSRLKLYYR